jgi:hypothetical protein
MSVPLPFVRRVCFDLLGRSPKDQELLAAEQQTAETFVRPLCRTRDAFEWWYEEELYYFLLLDNFRPRTPLTEALPDRLSKSELTIRDAVQEIVISTGFTGRNPGPDTFVTVVLEQLLGITVQKDKSLLEAGKKMYDGYKSRVFGKEGQSQSDLVALCLREPLFATHYVGRHLRRLLRRDPTPKEIEPYATRFRDKPGEFPEVMAEILLSPAYADALLKPRSKNDHQFLRGLYVDVLGRLPDAQELRNLRNALQSLADTTPIRLVLVRMVLDSGKAKLPGADLAPAEATRALFRRLLGRAPSQKEQDTYAGMLTRKECTLAQAARALLTSPDYQTY